MSDVHRRFLLDGVHHSRKKSARKRETEEIARKRETEEIARKRETEEIARKRETAARAHQSCSAPAAPEHQSLTEGNVGKRMIWLNTNIYEIESSKIFTWFGETIN